jgi:hypothetical protein
MCLGLNDLFGRALDLESLLETVLDFFHTKCGVVEGPTSKVQTDVHDVLVEELSYNLHFYLKSMVENEAEPDIDTALENMLGVLYTRWGVGEGAKAKNH